MQESTGCPSGHDVDFVAIYQGRHVVNQKMVPAILPDLIGKAIVRELTEYLVRPLCVYGCGPGMARVLAPLMPGLRL